ncbi:MAG: hypothetical protein V2I34_04355, partial [Bacteroidales bacterium]|nr:hypothetical protein [Bacteroidales bacterium]
MSKKIPITVGIVGHLDIITTVEQRKELESLFEGLAAKYPNSPIHLISSIAEGADRFVAKVFLDMKKDNEKYRERFELIVPMPFS